MQNLWKIGKSIKKACKRALKSFINLDIVKKMTTNSWKNL
jgi:hypothetical protein